MAVKSRKGKISMCEGQLIGREAGAYSTLHEHWASGTKQHSGVTMEPLPLSCQILLYHYKNERTGKDHLPTYWRQVVLRSGVSCAHRLPFLETELEWLEDRCGGRKLTIRCRHQGTVLLPRPSGITALFPQLNACCQGTTGTTRQPGKFSL